MIPVYASHISQDWDDDMCVLQLQTFSAVTGGHCYLLVPSPVVSWPATDFNTLMFVVDLVV
jgi:hypothetical protein